MKKNKLKESLRSPRLCGECLRAKRDLAIYSALEDKNNDARERKENKMKTKSKKTLLVIFLLVIVMVLIAWSPKPAMAQATPTRQDTIVWEYIGGDPKDAHRLSNGNTLIADYNGHRVIEVTPDCTIVWEYDCQNGSPNSAERLTNGNTLISGGPIDHSVIEVTPDCTVIWEYILSEASPPRYQPFQAQRLSNGNTLIASFHPGSVIEVDPAGTIIWECDGLASPEGARRLSNGNTLITVTYSNRVIEVDEDGTVVWQYSTGLDHPARAEHLSNGNTLIADEGNNRVIEVTPDYNIVWEYSTGRARSVERLTNGNTLISFRYPGGPPHGCVIEVAPIFSVVISVPDTTYGVPGATITVPIMADTLTGLGILYAEFALSYNSTIIIGIDVDTCGTLLSGTDWSLEYNVVGNTLLVTMGGTDTLAGSGTLINLIFAVSPDAQSEQESPLHFENFIFNDGTPRVTTQDGVFIVIPPFGAIEGTVTEATREPIEGAIVTAYNMFIYCDTTDVSGHYFIPEVVSETYSMTVTAAGYNQFDTTGIIVLPEDTTEVNFQLTHPVIVVEPMSFNVDVDIGASLDTTIYITNNGNGPLHFNMSTDGIDRFLKDVEPHGIPPIQRGLYRGIRAIKREEFESSIGAMGDYACVLADKAPNAEPWTGNREPSDILWWYDVQNPTCDLLCLGVEFDGTYYYITGGNSGNDPNKIYIFDAQGNYIASVDQVNSSDFGWRDIAYDGEYMYSSDDALITQWYISGLPDNPVLNVVDEFSGPYICPTCVNRALAYDPATDHFFTADFLSGIFEFDRSGTLINWFPNYNYYVIYGLAWDDVSPDGPWLWVFTQDDYNVRQFDPVTGYYTGVVYEGFASLYDGLAGGSCFAVQDGLGVFIGLTQGGDWAPDLIFGMELFTIPWLTYRPRSGEIPAGETLGVNLHFDATLATPGTTYTGTLQIMNNSSTPQIDISVTMYVRSPEMAVDPISFELELHPETTFDTTMTITNTGEAPLDFTAVIIPSQGSRFVKPIEIHPVGFLLSNGVNPDRISPIQRDLPGGISPIQQGLPSGINPIQPSDIVDISSYTLRPSEEDTIHYDGPNQGNALGLTGGGTAEQAIRLTPEELGPYNGWQLISALFYHYEGTHSGQIKIYGAGTPFEPGALITSEPYSVTGETWLRTDLTTPVIIDITQDLWTSVEITQSAGEYPMGVDEGPAVAGKGDFDKIGDGPWTELILEGLPYNWNIRAIVASGWLSVTPYIGTIPSGQSLDITVQFETYGLTPESTYTANIAIHNNSVDSPVNVPITMHILSAQYGAIEGTVTEVENGPIEGAIVTAHNTYTYRDTTDANGHYFIPEAVAAIYNMTVTAPGYNQCDTTGIVIVAGEVTEVNFQLTYPEIAITPSNFEIELPVDTIYDTTMIISNIGNGSLEFIIDVLTGEQRTGIHIATFADKNRVLTGSCPASFCRTPADWVSNPDASLYPGEIIESHPSIGSPTGFEWDGTYFWQGNWDGYVVKSDSNFNFIAQYTACGDPDMAPTGLAWHNGHLYQGCYTENNVYKIDVSNGYNPVGTISVPGAGGLMGVEWIGDHLWVTDDNTELIYECDSLGNMINSYPAPDVVPFGISYNPYIDIIYLNGWSGGNVYSIDPHTGDCNFAFPTPGTSGAFSCTGGSFDNRHPVYLWIAHQNDNMIYLTDTGSFIEWITVMPNTGTVPPEETFGATVHFDTRELTPDSTYTANIRIHNNSAESPVDIPVTMHIITVGVEDDAPQIPRVFALIQNYPNPFSGGISAYSGKSGNPQTTISYSLPKSCKVSLKIYNIKGQLVETLVNDKQQPGYYSVVWESKDVSPGIYLYRITAGDFTDTKKCVILK